MASGWTGLAAILAAAWAPTEEELVLPSVVDPRFLVGGFGGSGGMVLCNESRPERGLIGVGLASEGAGLRTG